MHSDIPPAKIEYGTYKAYFIGFVLSIFLTFLAYFLATSTLLSGWVLDCTIGLLACLQALIQLILFFNLTNESSPRWNLLVFLFTLMVIAILVLGSIWIMYHLNYNLMQ